VLFSVWFLSLILIWNYSSLYEIDCYQYVVLPTYLLYGNRIVNFLSLMFPEIENFSKRGMKDTRMRAAGMAGWGNARNTANRNS